MKKAYILLTLIFPFLLQTACNNDDDITPVNPIDQLPPATQIGANAGGCLVDGKAFLPDRKTTIPFRIFYLDGETFGLSISDEVNGVGHNLLVFLENVQIEENIVYILNTEFDDDLNNQNAEYIIASTAPPSPNYYTTTPTVTGEIVFTNHDFDNAILSGTFWFDAVNSEGEIVKIREGRFDMEY